MSDDATASLNDNVPTADAAEAQESSAEGASRSHLGRRLAIIGAGVVLAVGIAYGVAYSVSGERAPRHVTVAGIDIGGMTASEAQQTLATKLGGQAMSPITVDGVPSAQQLTPIDVGLSVDYPATVAAAGIRKSAHPGDIWRVITGFGNTDPVVIVVDEQARQATAGLSQHFTAAVAEPVVEVTDGTVNYTPPVTGATFDVDATKQRIIDGWVAGMSAKARGAVLVEAAQELTEPTVSKTTSDEFVKKLTNNLRPIAVTTSNGNFEVTSAQIGSATHIETKGAELSSTVDLPALYAAAADGIASVSSEKPVDAQFVFEDSKPVIVPSKDGLTISEDDFASAIEPVLEATGERTVTIEVSATQPAFTTADAEALGVKEVIGEFTTWFPHTWPAFRNTNLGLVANAINGTLLKPGETFDFDKIVGSRNYANGYVDGGVLVDGRIEMAVGGGISQSATTIYNAGFFAGMKDIEHHPHYLYFNRYPMGREATLWEGTLNLRFQNDTAYGALVQAWIVPSTPSAEGSITVRIWSSKTYDDIQSTEPYAYNYKAGGKREITGDDCLPQPASSGFDVDYSRLFINAGEVVKREDYFWRYLPADEIVCKPKDPPPAPETPAPETPASAPPS